MGLICGVISSGQSRQLGHLYPLGPPPCQAPQECSGDCTLPQGAGSGHSLEVMDAARPLAPHSLSARRIAEGQQRPARGWALGGCTGQVGPRMRQRCEGRGLGTGPQKVPATARWGGSQAELWGPSSHCWGRGTALLSTPDVPAEPPWRQPSTTGQARTGPRHTAPASAEWPSGLRAPGPRVSLKGLSDLGPCASSARS